LQTLYLSYCEHLQPDWLPVSTRANLRRLSVVHARLQRLPEGLCALEELDVSGCKALADDWLPACSAARVRTLIADQTNLTRLPEGLHALTRLSSEACPALQAEFDRRSSRVCYR
jgi:hypothetical protein